MSQGRVVQLLILWLVGANFLVSVSNNPADWFVLPSFYVSFAVLVFAPILALAEIVDAMGQ